VRNDNGLYNMYRMYVNVCAEIYYISLRLTSKV